MWAFFLSKHLIFFWKTNKIFPDWSRFFLILILKKHDENKSVKKLRRCVIFYSLILLYITLYNFQKKRNLLTNKNIKTFCVLKITSQVCLFKWFLGKKYFTIFFRKFPKKKKEICRLVKKRNFACPQKPTIFKEILEYLNWVIFNHACKYHFKLTIFQKFQSRTAHKRKFQLFFEANSLILCQHLLGFF